MKLPYGPNVDVVNEIFPHLTIQQQAMVPSQVLRLQLIWGRAWHDAWELKWLERGDQSNLEKEGWDDFEM